MAHWWLPFALAGAVAAQADLAALVEKLAAEDGSVRYAAYRELQNERSGKIVGLLVPRLPAMPRDGQRLGLYLLEGQPPDAVREAMTKLARADQPLLRVAATAWLARQFGGEGDPKAKARAMDAFAEALRACPPEFVGEAVPRIQLLRDEACYVAARSHLRPDCQPGVAVDVLRCLRAAETQQSAATTAATQLLLAATASGVRAAAMAYLAEADAAQATALAGLLQAEPELFWRIQDLLQAHPKLAEPLAEAAASALRRPRSRFDVEDLARWLGRVASDKVRAALRDLLASKVEEVRAEALEQLAALPGGLDDKDLRDLLAGPTPAGRLVAAEALRKRDDPSGLPVVIELCKQPSPQRLDAVRALGAFRDRRAVPALLDLLADGDGAVREFAYQGLQRTWDALFPYRRFDFGSLGFDARAQADAAAVATLRRWWDQHK